ncbi:MAG: elongation factor P maturation arginine rhamnosyltransferase EarP [Sterolibacterium sp.]|jgi:uncharacterized repeat protein (TIGR03837 family)|nr:elongation factor P maturation arginine rhamnosyltransferase EarP [Sterolibacterium sp.]
MPPRKRWDIFCTVIDNYGDIGVCWRFARQLVAEHGFLVRLWVDDLASFQPLCPELDIDGAEQMIQGVCLRHWPAQPARLSVTDAAAVVADVVIEAFACELPPAYLTAMAAQSHQPVWINLEYLSAEQWVADCHGLASPHPQLPLTKHFFFPGFTASTGGLLREAGLFEQRDRWQANQAQARTHFGLPPAVPGECLISLFCYENPRLPALLHAWNEMSQPVHCLVPHGKALTQVLAHIDKLPQGSLSIQPLPFVRQEDYDLLLWICDLNFVRGEDSFVRALWAGRPLVWQIYPQEEDTHLTKLTAFLELYGNAPGVNPDSMHALSDFWQCWNGAGNISIQTAWKRYAAHLRNHAHHARQWSDHLAEQTDLTRRLVEFCKKQL